MSLLTVMAEDSGDVLDSWEDQVDSGVLDERLKKISVSDSYPTQSARTQAVMMSEDTGRTAYQPQVRILKREPNTNHNTAVGNTIRNTSLYKPMKSLEQREAEYAEARMRIFGAAETQSEPDSNNSANNYEEIPPVERQYRISKAETKSANDVIRQPLGPDGSTGFNFKR